MDENKIIRIILQAKDEMTGSLARALKRTRKEIGEFDKDVLDSKRNFKLYERDVEKLSDTFSDLGPEIENATKEVQKMTRALTDAEKTAERFRKKVKGGVVGIVQDIAGEEEGRRTVRGAGGRFISGKGTTPGEVVLVDNLKKIQKFNLSFNDALSKGYRLARDTSKELDHQLGATKAIRKERLHALEDAYRAKKLELSLAQDEERANRLERIQEKQDPLLEERLLIVREIDAARKTGDLEEEQRQLDLYKKKTDQIEDIARREYAIITKKYKKARADEAQFYVEQKRNINSLSAEEGRRIVERIREERNALLNAGTRRDRVTKRVGFAFGDFFGGIQRGRDDVRDLDKDLERLTSRFGRLGFAIGGAFRDLNSFVNLRWLFITSVITLLINILTQLVVVLVSVASSAIIAAEALGGALVSGALQAIPVIGLLAAAFHSLTKAMEAAKLQDKASIKSANDLKESTDKRKQAVQRLADAHYAVGQAVQSVKDAEYNFAKSKKDLVKSYEDEKEAITDLADARKQAAQDIVDANLQEKDSALALEEAELAVLSAKQKLREEQEKSRRNQTDVTQAQAAVKEAQDRLKVAKAQGDAAEIILANQQLSIAEQNLSSIQDNIDSSQTALKDAQLGVERAEINRQQAANKKRKDEKEAADLRKKGIAQADIVIQAEKQLVAATEGIADAQRQVAASQRAVADAIHSANVARREERDARQELADKTNFQSTAQKNLNEAIADLSPAEKRLYKALVRMKNAYKKTFSGTKNKDGILAPIIDGFTAIADSITKLLTDPKIIAALDKLSKSIGAGLQKFATILSSKSFRDDFLQFINDATDNLPKVFNILFNIFGLIRKIGKEASPIFGELIGGLDSLFSRANKAAGEKVKVSQNFAGRPEEGTRGPNAPQEQTRLGRFFEGARKHLKEWLAFGKAIGRVIYLLTNVSAPTGQSLIESATAALNRLGDYIEKNPEKVQEFFKKIADAFKTLANALLDLIEIFGKAAANENVQNFAIFLIDTIIPGIYLMIEAVGALAGALNAFTKIPFIGPIVEWAIKIAVAEKALNKLFPISQGLTNFIRVYMVKAFVLLGKVILHPIQALKELRIAIQLTGIVIGNFVKNIKNIGPIIATQVVRFKAFVGAIRALAATEGIIAALSAAFPVLGAAIGTAIELALGPIGLIILAIAAIVTALILLDRKFHFIRPTINFFLKSLKAVFNWIKDHWRLVVALITGPIGVAVLLIIKHWNKIKKLFFGFSKLLTKFFFKPVYNILIKPFVEAQKFIISLWKKLPGILGDIIKRIPGVKQLLGIGKKVGGFFKGVVNVAAGAVGAVGSAADTADTALGGKHPKKISPTKVLNNDARDAKLIKRLRSKGMSDAEILNWLIEHGSISKANFRRRFGFPLSDVQGFAIGGHVPGSGIGDTVPAMLTPGEWVLNKEQQGKLSNAIGAPKHAIADYLFKKSNRRGSGVQKFGIGGIVKDLKMFLTGGGTDQPIIPFQKDKTLGKVTNKNVLDIMRQLTFALTGADGLEEFQKKPSILNGISAAIGLPIFFGRGYSAGKSGAKTIKSLQSLEEFANKKLLKQKNWELGANIDDIYKMVNKAPLYHRGVKVKRGRLYRVDFGKDIPQHAMGGFDVPNRLAVIQDPKTGALFATGRADVHHGDLMKRVGELGFFPTVRGRLPEDRGARFTYRVKGKTYNYTDWMQHQIRGTKTLSDAEAKAVGQETIPGAVMFDYRKTNSLRQGDTRAATIGRMRLIRDLQDAGFDVGAFIRKVKPAAHLMDDWEKARQPFKEKGVTVWRGITMHVPTKGDLMFDATPERIDQAIKNNLGFDWSTGIHWSVDPNVAKSFAKPRQKEGVYGIVIKGQVLPEDIVKQYTKEWEYWAKEAGAVGMNTGEREVVVRPGSQMRLLEGYAYLPDGRVIKIGNVDDNLVKVKHGYLKGPNSLINIIPKDTSRWTDDVQMVSTKILESFMEFNRAKTNPGQVAKLVEDIRKNGIIDPLILHYGYRDKKAYLGEGNHRLAAAIKLGLDQVPVRVSRRLDTEFAERSRTVPGWKGQGIPPTELKPSDIGIAGAIDWKNFKKFSAGIAGVPGTGTGDTVPAMLTPGEWVLNKDQLRKLSSVTGMSLQQIKANVFGTKIPTGNPGVWGTAGKGLKPSKRKSPIIGGSFTLSPQEDDDGNTVWFIELADGTFGQVTARDAQKIENTNGAYIPAYVKRNTHGFTQRIRTQMNPLGFANGGIVPSSIRGFAAGGIVQTPGFGNTNSKNTQVHQNFNVKTEGSTDWAYVMRLSAITAQSAF